MTPTEKLFEAASSGDLEAVQTALAKGASLEAKDVVDMTPLTLAVRGGHIKVILYLLEQGARVTNDTLYVASMSVNSNPMLLKYLQLVQMKQVKPQVEGLSQADAALLTAADAGDSEALKAALALQANPNISDAQDTTALRWATRRRHNDLVIALLGAGANINQASSTGWTALMEAVLNSDEVTVKAFILLGADVNAKTFADASVLYFAHDIVPLSSDREAAQRIIELLEQNGAILSAPPERDD
jgi:ankyrin repeat protein